MASLKKNSLYNTKINKYLELSVAMRNLWCLEKISILPLTGNQLNRVYVRARDYAKLYWSTCPVLFRPDTAHVTS
jgi:hypothetical protein